MKIFFAGSIRAGRADQELYLSVIKELQKYGTVLTEHIGDKKLTAMGEDNISTSDIYNREMDRLKGADMLIAEITTPSLGVGLEIGQAQAMGKRIVCLYRETPDKSLSAMISGNPNIEVFKYAQMADLVELFKKIFLN